MAIKKNVRDLFLDALDLADPAQRAAFLDRECQDDAELRARVEALLHAHDAPGPFLSAARPDAGEAAPPPAPKAALASAPAPAPTADHGDPSARIGALLAGKYKLVEAIGEGGMGTVYMAQQTEPVKRAVAIKVIKAGMDSHAVLARFEAERQALALMDHPNIAKVLDAGTTEGGQPFFVMELVKGIPITTFCDQRRLTPRQRLELFVPVCQAIQHAHQKGVIHRDIKPSNVLVALYDDQAVPKVIDFGVAKAAGQALTDKTLMTGFGAIVGTPEYMSPEQASLNNLDIDTRSDVYSLGVLLYELLTGTTPVDKKSLGKAAVLEVLRIVREVEALRPSAKLSSLDTLPTVAANRGTEPARLSRLLKGELDWLVLKALEKDRSRRYDTAIALSRDIQRYLADEVVEARPPSVAYRVSKFIRRHKGQTLATTLVVLALVGGIVGTTLGLFEAWRQERIARGESAEKEKALQAEAQRLKERDEANDSLLTVGARGLLRPLQLHSGPLNDQEVEALWELAAATDERLRLRFVEVGLEDPVFRQRLEERAPFALQAAVGLNASLRTRVEELLKQRLLEATSAKEQEQVVVCLCHLGDLDNPQAVKAAQELLRVPNALPRLAEGFAVVTGRLEPNEVARLCSQARATLIQAQCETTDDVTSRYLARGLLAVAERLRAARLHGQAAITLTQAMRKTREPTALQSLGQALAAEVELLEPKEAAEAAAILTEGLGKTTDFHALQRLAEGLSALVGRLEEKEASRLCGQGAITLTQAMRNTRDSSALQSLGQALSVVAGRLEAKEAAEAANNLLHALSKNTNPFALQSLARGLLAVAGRLETREAAEAANTLTKLLSKTTEFNAQDSQTEQDLAEGLSVLAGRLEAREASRICGPVAATLIQAMKKNGNPDALKYLAQGLSALAGRLEPKEAAEVANTLIQATYKPPNPFVFQYLVQCLSVVAGRLEPKEAARAANVLLQALSHYTSSSAVASLTQALSALAGRLEATEAARVCGQAAIILTEAKSKAFISWHDLAQGLSVLAGRLEAKKAAAVADALLQTMSKNTDPYALLHLARGISAVTERLEAKKAARVCDQAANILIQAMSNNTDADPRSWEYLAQGLSALAGCLEATEAARVCGQGAITLTQAMSKTREPSALQSLGQALSVVAGRLEPKEAAVVTNTLIQAMNKTTNHSALERLSHALSAVAGCLEAKEAAEAANNLLQALRKTRDFCALMYLSRGVSVVAKRLEGTEAARVCGQAANTITQVMSKTTDFMAFQWLEEGLSALAGRLEAKEAAEVANNLLQVMRKTRDFNAFFSLSRNLAMVAGRLEAKEAAEVTNNLLQVMSKNTYADPRTWEYPARALSAVAGRLEPKEAGQLAGQAAATLLQAMSTPSFSKEFAKGLSAALARGLSPQTLVDLLKHPLCVGDARRRVLDALARHYHRPFADQWDFVDYVRQQKLDLDLTTPPAWQSRFLPTTAKGS